MLEHLISLIEREIELIEHAIINGGCPDFLTYREQIAALNAYRHVVDLAKRAFREDDDDT